MPQVTKQRVQGQAIEMAAGYSSIFYKELHALKSDVKSSTYFNGLFNKVNELLFHFS